eukprot:TRINITY_DN1340_c0_g1_i1.p1 TRINITY_DN1340_c0_g1~~TRINITY_DN1340_c0_g1_i1.p1  ORF type:complete len:188 (+),score=45.93 TRINITY_DN1340_c0_g1_i1:21-584(+)
MGSALSAKLLFIGLDGSGKTSILTFLNEGPFTKDPNPTTGFDIRDTKYKGVKFTIYDVAGGQKVRELWKHYFEDTDAVVFVVDSSNPDRFAEAKAALEFAIKDPGMRKDCPFLVVANKCDVNGAKSETDVKGLLDLDGNLSGRSWKILKTDGKKGDGVYEGFAWLSENIKAEHKKGHHSKSGRSSTH